MGVRASFYEAAPEHFEAAKQENTNHVLETVNQCGIEKCWYLYDRIFLHATPPLSQFLAGDILFPYSPQTLDDFRTGEYEWYFAYYSPELVRKLSDELQKLTLSDLESMAGGDTGWPPGHDCYLEDIKRIFSSASAAGNMIYILIA